LVAAYFASKYQYDDKPGSVHNISDDAAIWMLQPEWLNESQGYDPVFPPLNATTLEPLLRPAIKGGDESPIQVLAASPLETDPKMISGFGSL